MLNILPIFLLQIPGGKLVTDGLEGAAKSNSSVISGLLVALLILSYIGFVCVFKYFIKKHKEELAQQLVSNAEKHAIDIGAQQLVVAGKDEVIKTLRTENEYHKSKVLELTEDKTMILKDNTEAFRQIGTKVGQHTDALVTILGELKQNHSDMKLYILTEFKPR
jgi:Zn-dependent alcohol dehydrogenase